MEFSQRLTLIRKTVVGAALSRLTAPHPQVTLFFSVSDGKARADVVHASGGSLESAWQKGLASLRAVMAKRQLKGKWVRVDWVEEVEATTWGGVKRRLANTKRNYFRHGLALDPELSVAFLEQELNANAMLYGGNQVSHAIVNEKNFLIYARKRYGEAGAVDFADDKQAYIFSTAGIFCDEEGEVFLLGGAGTDAGRRRIDRLSSADIASLIESGSRFLAQQVGAEGAFVYGYHPCFDRQINAYNTLRHASTTYAMIEAWEITRDMALKAAIERALDYLCTQCIHKVALEDGGEAAFLVEVGDEIKLGGNAVAILALAKYAAVTGTDRYHRLLENLALGIRFMQNSEDGSFVHVLNFPDLTIKESFRTIYYDGEAAFGLMRLYSLTRDERWLEMVEKAFGYFIEKEHWQYHDHWLSYCVNELTRYRPEERYFRFGLRNVSGYLDFVLERITTFPTLLELMMASREMLTRIEALPELGHLLAEIDRPKFERALDYRAHYLLNGHFWPEMAMYFGNPARIVGSFFIRHHAFRVRIDDVEHYLSGYVAYLKYRSGEGPKEQKAELEGAGASPPAGASAQARPVAPAQPRLVHDTPIRVGMLRMSGRPGAMAVACAHAAAMQGAQLVYFGPSDVNIETRSINVLIYEGGGWTRRTTPIPPVIDNDEDSRSATAVWDVLSRHARMTTPQLGGKLEVMRRMEAAGLYDEHRIPSVVITCFDDLLDSLLWHSKIVTKPIRSAQGANVSFFSCEDEGYKANIGGRAALLDADGLRAFYESHIKGRNYIAQKYISSTTLLGLPFDIRLHLRRDHLAEWRTVKIYARIGGERGVTSNLNTGGSVAFAHTFLRGQFGRKSKAIWARLQGLAREFPPKFQALYDDRIIDALGVDLGVDREGKMWIFEVNSYPGAKYFPMEAAIPRMGYALHLARDSGAIRAA